MPVAGYLLRDAQGYPLRDAQGYLRRSSATCESCCGGCANTCCPSQNGDTARSCCPARMCMTRFAYFQSAGYDPFADFHLQLSPQVPVTRPYQGAAITGIDAGCGETGRFIYKHSEDNQAYTDGIIRNDKSSIGIIAMLPCVGLTNGQKSTIVPPNFPCPVTPIWGGFGLISPSSGTANQFNSGTIIGSANDHTRDVYSWQVTADSYIFDGTTYLTHPSFPGQEFVIEMLSYTFKRLVLGLGCNQSFPNITWDCSQANPLGCTGCGDGTEEFVEGL